MQSAAVRSQRRPRPATGIWLLGVGLSLFSQFAMAAEKSPELVQPPVCSAAAAGQLDGICVIKSLGNGHNEIKVNLTAASAPIAVGGYKVITGNYNGNYLTPVIEAMPGDTLSAHLVNSLPPKAHGGTHGDAGDNPTNLHYFHGGIVSPNNARPKPAELGNGDNVYVHLKSGLNADGKPNSFDLEVPIPGEQELDGRVLESAGFISHPLGLNWYHSHMHGMSADQVMGGMSGFLSVGEATANVKALCQTDPNDKSRCLNDVESETRDLRSKTKVRYAMLRDIPLITSKRPDQADGDTAEWDLDPAARIFDPRKPCGVWKQDNSGLDDNVKLRTGFCQRDGDSALLFTVNGQRFPTITVEANQNLLLRLGNLGANIPYWLELNNEADDKVLPLTLLSLDGVVPAKPVAPGQAQEPVQALNSNNLLLMSAARAEIYVRNDEEIHAVPRVYILRTRKHRSGPDEWPEIQLARIVLQPNAVANKTSLALNVPAAGISSRLTAEARIDEPATLPDGCVRDLDPAFHEYRRVTFKQTGADNNGVPTGWSMLTEIVRPQGKVLKDETEYASADPDKSTVGGVDGGGVPFEKYVNKEDGLVKWTKRHACIHLDHRGSHKQLWVLVNGTDFLHNFHIHQIKFRLATATELAEGYTIQPPTPSHTCDEKAECTEPDYAFYDDEKALNDPGSTRRWHDTIPMPPKKTVFIVMSFDARQQVGRFVFHCHVLGHEDNGLMAPIEVWEPRPASLLK